ncbi:unnamed protein product [marine sediment metagenome]|uniref:Uncharacterized protein n=1 Tax=marine sediment metagenome TaxID=412755 RepID=X1HC77_9ZZZZ
MLPPVKTNPGRKNSSEQELTFGANIPEFGPEGQGETGAYQNKWNGLGNGFFDSIYTSKGSGKDLPDSIEGIYLVHGENNTYHTKS